MINNFRQILHLVLEQLGLAFPLMISLGCLFSLCCFKFTFFFNALLILLQPHSLSTLRNMEK